MNFYFEHTPKEYIEVNIFGIHDFEGEPTESEEMRPKWFHINDIPYDLMWPDDIHWHHLFFSGKKFKGEFHFKNYDTILRHEIKEVTNL
jgi:8-oxo-dGTP diphosphatase / 2-hydroxy-dATP diphosphatase